MEDRDIVELYWARSERAILETAGKYGGYCRAIIRRVLGSREDAEECLSDTWLGAWNAMPPQRPERLGPFLGRIARNTALDRYHYNTARKRSGGFETLLEELEECVSGTPLEEDFALKQLGEAISAFLETLPPVQRQVFLRRYWACVSLREIAGEQGFSVPKVKSMLHRTRQGLRAYLTQEGYDL